MTFSDFYDQLVFELVFHNGIVLRGKMKDIQRYLKEIDCGSTLKVADEFWQPRAVKSFVADWKRDGCEKTIEEYFQSQNGGQNATSDEVSSEDL